MKKLSGFTLIEILIALAILTVALVSVAKFQSSGIKENVVSQQRSLATFLAESKLEELHNTNFAIITNGSDVKVDDPNNPKVTYTRQWTVTSTTADTKTVAITISWNDNEGNPSNLDLSTTILDRASANGGGGLKLKPPPGTALPPPPAPPATPPVIIPPPAPPVTPAPKTPSPTPTPTPAPAPATTTDITCSCTGTSSSGSGHKQSGSTLTAAELESACSSCCGSSGGGSTGGGMGGMGGKKKGLNDTTNLPNFMGMGGGTTTTTQSCTVSTSGGGGMGGMGGGGKGGK